MSQAELVELQKFKAERRAEEEKARQLAEAKMTPTQKVKTRTGRASIVSARV